MAKRRKHVRVDTRKLERLQRELSEKPNQVKIGVLASKGGLEKRDGITMVELAAIHEFGSPKAGIPERSFIRRAFFYRAREGTRPDTRRAIQRVGAAFMKGRASKRLALEILGAWGVAQVQRTITGTPIPPPLRPATIKRKKSTRPLVDTGRLLQSLAWEIEE